MRLSGMGSIRPLEKGRCRKWQVIARAVDDDGKRRQFTRVVHGGKRDAQAALDELKAKVSGIVENDETVSDYLDGWLKWKATSVSHQTLMNYVSAFNVWRPLIGEIKMEELNSSHIRKAIPALLDGRSKRTVYQYMIMLSVAMKSAVIDGLIAKNPLSGVDRPRWRPTERRALEPAALDELWTNIEMVDDGSPQRIAFLLMIDCGLRCIECRKLEVGCVSDGFLIVGESKTAAGRGRRIPLTKRMSRVLEEWIEWRGEIGASGALLVHPDGQPLSQRSLESWWWAHRDKWGCGDITPHGLRHSNLSRMARHMGAHDLMRWAGWKDISMALVYVHDDDQQLLNAVERMQNGA